MNQNTSTAISAKPIIVPKPYEITPMMPVISASPSGRIHPSYEREYSAKMNELTSVIDTNVAAALAEDIGSGDLTAQLIPATTHAGARVITREDAVICGARWFDACFRKLDSSVSLTWMIKEGERASA